MPQSASRVLFKPEREALDEALRSGLLSNDPRSERFAGHYRYLGHFEGVGYFQHVTGGAPLELPPGPSVDGGAMPEPSCRDAAK